jgi:hypothetical protein
MYNDKRIISKIKGGGGGKSVVLLDDPILLKGTK